MKFLYTILLFCLGSILYSQNYNLELEITNVKKPKGQMIISLYTKAEDFPKRNKEYRRMAVIVNSKVFNFTIKDLPKGTYAIALFHDENKDEEIDLNFLGIPKEAYGFSNNVRPLFSAPSFKDTQFTLNDSEKLSIKLIH